MVEKIKQNLVRIQGNLQIRPQRGKSHQPEKYYQNDDSRNEERPQQINITRQGGSQKLGGNI